MNRREFLKQTGIGGATALGALAVSPLAEAARLPDYEGLEDGFFNQKERIALAGLCDSILPKSAQMGAVEYIEQLLTAFDYDPPRIFAGGPYSGRRPFWKEGVPSSVYPENEFKRFVPLTRLQEKAWRWRIYGGPEFETHYLMGPGTITNYRKLVKDAVGSTIKWLPGNLLKKSKKAYGLVLYFQDDKFKKLLNELVVEAAFSPPEYGGNKNLMGWKVANFEGDSAPLGFARFNETTGKLVEFAEESLTGPNPQPEKNPIGFFMRLFLKAVTIFQHGKEG